MVPKPHALSAMSSVARSDAAREACAVTTLQQRSAQDQQRDGEVDNQPGDIYEGSDKGGGGGGGIEPQTPQDEREHRAGDTPEQDDADQQ